MDLSLYYLFLRLKYFRIPSKGKYGRFRFVSELARNGEMSKSRVKMVFEPMSPGFPFDVAHNPEIMSESIHLAGILGPFSNRPFSKSL